MLDELLAHDEVTETCVLRSRVGFMALHAGLEEGTGELAAAAADANGGSLYEVQVGSGLWWHVPSTRFHPRHSEALESFLRHVEVVFSIHGYGRRRLGPTILLGGSNRQLADDLARSLRSHTDLHVITDLHSIPRGLRGTHPDNPVNLPRRGGVQVELPPSARNGRARAAIADAMVATVDRLRDRLGAPRAAD